MEEMYQDFKQTYLSHPLRKIGVPLTYFCGHLLDINKIILSYPHPLGKMGCPVYENYWQNLYVLYSQFFRQQPLKDDCVSLVTVLGLI